MGVEQPLFLHEDVLPAIPSGWVWSRSDSLVIQRKPGKLFDTKTVAATGAVPVLNQSENGVLGYHDEEPGVVASAGAPVVTFANHTCAMRLVKHPFSAIQNIFPKVGKQGVCDTVWFYYALLGRVRTNEYKGHHPLFRDAFVPVPPLAVQRRIASILSAYDDLIENNTRRIAILEEMARRIYEEWFVRFRFPGHEAVRMVESELGLVPDGWSVAPLGSVADVQWGDTTVTKKSYVAEGYTAYSAAGPDGLLPYADHNRTGIVLSAIGSCGTTWLATGSWSCIKNTIRFFSSNAERACDEFLFLATRSKSFWPTRGAAQPFISLGDARAQKLVVPSPNVMQSFCSLVRPQLALSASLDHQNRNLRATRDLLLPKLISGELDVSALPEPETVAA